MSAETSKKQKPAKSNNIFRQMLCEDYWEGYYALTDGSIVKLSDPDGENACFSIFNLKNGKQSAEGSIHYGETTLFQDVASAILETTGAKVYLRLSNEVENPDRQSEIETILASGDRFQIMRIRNLEEHLSSKSINLMGGKVGGQNLYGGEFEGFYILDDGKILYCRDLSDWNDDIMDRIVDGVLSYRILDTGKFDLDASREQFFGYLEDEKFSEFASSIVEKHGKGITKIAARGTDLYNVLSRAMKGDAEAAAIASHRLKINLCIKV